jgi:hypothetical protein
MREGGGGMMEAADIDADACVSLLGPVGTSIDVAILAADLESTDVPSAPLLATFSESTSSVLSELGGNSASIAWALTES